MHFLTDKIGRLKLGWNDTPLDESHFYQICAKFRISVVEMPLRVSGFYYRVMGRDFIAINSRLSGDLKLVVMFHELGHYILHTPDTGATANFHGVKCRWSRKEIEADAFALCAVIPLRLIKFHSPAELIHDGFSDEIVAARLGIFERHGF